MNDLNDFKVRDTVGIEHVPGHVQSSSDKAMNGTGRRTFEAIKMVEAIRKTALCSGKRRELPWWSIQPIFATNRTPHQG